MGGNNKLEWNIWLEDQNTVHRKEDVNLLGQKNSKKKEIDEQIQ